jgi:23S rRNA (cytosine1962-C5)-methyltransferase
MPNQYPKIYLKPHKEEFVHRKHPWIFSGALQPLNEKIPDGNVVEVFSSRKEYLATGHYFAGSIAVRILSFEQCAIDIDFWKNKIQSANSFRQKLNLTDNIHTNCYRLINAEGDGLPGLIIDWYNGTAVLQAHTSGVYAERDNITEALQDIYGTRLHSVYNKSEKTVQQARNEYLYGNPQNDEVIEYGNRFKINWETGQKTGFFLDQRDNRMLLTKYVKGKTVLNAFCYSGGFSVYALNAGASEVHSVDVSKTAMELTDGNIALCNAEGKHQSFTADVLEFLQKQEQPYEVMVLDPPAFAKNIATRHNAVQGYKRLNALGLSKIAKGGILFTFSCSQVVDRELFYHTITAAAIEANRKVRVMHHLSQPPDHPVNIFHPEGHYLKGLALYVE